MTRRSFEEFRAQRARGNEAIGSADLLSINRFMRLDSATYEDATASGGMSAKAKEMLGLVASMVLRCNDCIDYHLEQCVKHGFSRREIIDGMNVALVVGGSIVIPHLRHAMLSLEELLAENR